MIVRQITVALALLTCSGFAAAQRCSLRATNVAFGNYNGAVVRMTGTLTVSCPFGTIYSVALDAGTGRGATVTNRSMSIGTDQLHYGLFHDPAYISNWGDTFGTGLLIGIGTGVDQVYNVYGQVPANQDPVPGRGRLYQDTIIATLSGRGSTTETSNLRITANVLDACSVSAAGLAFGRYSGSVIDSVSAISVSCTDRTDYNVGLNNGTATGSTVTNRRMTGPGASLLRYSLFRDSRRTLNWGNTVGINTVPGTGNGRTQSLTVYGRLPPDQSAAGGNYSDTITVTVTF